tara:strand:+ start:257 stop:391 length:135 start_codon:yes stop_codon:yes gene_type:complete
VLRDAAAMPLGMAAHTKSQKNVGAAFQISNQLMKKISFLFSKVS